MEEKNIIIDSNMTFHESIGSKINEIPSDILSQLILKDVEYYSFDGLLHRGQVVINSSIEESIDRLFTLLREIKFPIEKVIPISKYGDDDFLSMEDNNSSAFNYRFVYNTTRLSQHAYGTAIDLNPRCNPYFTEGVWYPSGATYNVETPGTLLKDGEIVKLMESMNFVWGGTWDEKDYHHFNLKK